MSVNPDDLTPDQQALIEGLQEDAANRYLAGDLGALRHSMAFRPHDPAFGLLLDGVTSTPEVHRPGCYICEDPEFAAMGLPLCRKCPACKRRQEDCGACKGTGDAGDHTSCIVCLGTGKLGSPGHIAADDNVCDECSYEDGPEDYQ